ncbi:MAG: cache domain-containing protein, partial [Clostridia bacterium]
MNSMEEINVFFKEKSGKKLSAFSGCVFLLITAIVFFASFTFCRDAQLELMDKGLGELLGIIEGRENELVMRSRAYEDDILTRAELGLKFYLEEDGLTDAEKLERLRDAVSAASVSLLDGQGQLLVSTGRVSPEEIFRTCIRTLEPRSPHLEFYPALSEDGEVTEENDGKGFVLLPVPGNTKRSLVFEFPCDAMLSLYNDLDDWSAILELLSGGGAAYARIGNRMAGYPLDGLTSEQTTRLFDELTKVFQNTDSFQRRENGSSSGIITLQGKRHLAALIQDPQDDADIMLTVPLKSVIGNGIYIALSISAVIGWGIMLFQIYVFHRLRQKETEKDADAASHEWVRRTTRPGILVMLAFTVIFSFMLLLLESRTNVSLTAVAGREILQQEIDWREAQKNAIRSTYSDIYRSRTQTLADFLTERPDYQTHAGLEELSGIANADYLMRFDSTGQELLSSNSYTGFSIGNNLSGEYQAVLMGYPYAVAGPAADPYTGRMQLGTAILMTDAEGQPDGFLLAVYSAEELNAELERMSYENTVNNTSVRKGYAAAISDEDGRFIAHTDPEMIGKKVEDSLPEYEPGSSFEGFTE